MRAASTPARRGRSYQTRTAGRNRSFFRHPVTTAIAYCHDPGRVILRRATYADLFIHRRKTSLIAQAVCRDRLNGEIVDKRFCARRLPVATCVFANPPMTSDIFNADSQDAASTAIQQTRIVIIYSLHLFNLNKITLCDGLPFCRRKASARRQKW